MSKKLFFALIAVLLFGGGWYLWERAETPKDEEATSIQEGTSVPADWLIFKGEGWSVNYPPQGESCEGGEIFPVCSVGVNIYPWAYRPKGENKDEYPFSCGHDYESCVLQWRQGFDSITSDRSVTISGMKAREIRGTWNEAGLGTHEFQILIGENDEKTSPIIITRTEFNAESDRMYDGMLKTLRP